MKNTLKKMMALLLALIMVLGLAACGEKQEEATGGEGEGNDEPVWTWEGEKWDDILANLGKAEVTWDEPTGVLKRVLDNGVLVVGTSPDYPPAEFVDLVSGEYKGTEILLANYIANSLGVELKIEAMDFGAILAAADTGKVDLAISGYGYKADRAEQYELSHGYSGTSAASHHTIAVRTEDLDKYNSLEDFTGIKIDAQVNSLQQMYVEDQLKDVELSLVTTLDQAIMELVGGKIDAVALDATTARNYAEQSDGKIVSMFVEKGVEFDLSLYSDFKGNVAAAKKGDGAQLIEVVNQIIDQITADGTYSTWYYASCDAAGVVPSSDE